MRRCAYAWALSLAATYLLEGDHSTILDMIMGLLDIFSKLFRRRQSPAPTPKPPVPQPPEPDADFVLALIDLHNKQRKAAGLWPLTLDKRLSDAARKHADWMAKTGTFSHTGQDGSTAGQRIAKAGYSWQSCGENIAAGHPTPGAVVDGWMKSPGHRDNILNGNYVNVGFGLAGLGTKYWVADFGRPLTSILEDDVPKLESTPAPLLYSPKKV